MSFISHSIRSRRYGWWMISANRETIRFPWRPTIRPLFVTAMSQDPVRCRATAYGAAIDINPVMNPYIVGDRVAPENGAMYVDRSLDLPGMIGHDDLCYQLFIAHGWTWGGDWSGDKDYQHFSKVIGF